MTDFEQAVKTTAENAILKLLENNLLQDSYINKIANEIANDIKKEIGRKYFAGTLKKGIKE